MNEIRIPSSLSKDALLKSIELNVEDQPLNPFSKYFGDDSITLGKVKGSSFWLRKNPGWYRNSFSQIFYGKVIDREDCCEVVGIFRIATHVYILSMIFFSYMFVFIVPMFCKHPVLRPTLLFCVIGMAVIGGVFGWWFVKWQEKEESVVMDFLKKRCLGI